VFLNYRLGRLCEINARNAFSPARQANLGEQVRECYEHAENCARKAAKTTSCLERSWLSLPKKTCAARTRGPQTQRDLWKLRGARSVQAITISNVLLLYIEQEIESLFSLDRLASEKSKAVGSQQKRQRLCFRPPHVPPDTFGLSDRR
jgi:hypothetical protein